MFRGRSTECNYISAKSKHPEFSCPRKITGFSLTQRITPVLKGVRDSVNLSADSSACKSDLSIHAVLLSHRRMNWKNTASLGEGRSYHLKKKTKTKQNAGQVVF